MYVNWFNACLCWWPSPPRFRKSEGTRDPYPATKNHCLGGLWNACFILLSTLKKTDMTRTPAWWNSWLLNNTDLNCMGPLLHGFFSKSNTAVVVELLSRVRLLWPHGLQPARLLCPWDFPGKNTGVGCHFLLQGIILIHKSNPGLLHCKGELQGKPSTTVLVLTGWIHGYRTVDIEELPIRRASYKLYLDFFLTVQKVSTPAPAFSTVFKQACVYKCVYPKLLYPRLVF